MMAQPDFVYCIHLHGTMALSKLGLDWQYITLYVISNQRLIKLVGLNEYLLLQMYQ